MKTAATMNHSNRLHGAGLRAPACRFVREGRTSAGARRSVSLLGPKRTSASKSITATPPAPRLNTTPSVCRVSRVRATHTCYGLVHHRFARLARRRPCGPRSLPGVKSRRDAGAADARGGTPATCGRADGLSPGHLLSCFDRDASSARATVDIIRAASGRAEPRSSTSRTESAVLSLGGSIWKETQPT
jgi:hypothetical protein